MNAHVRFFFVFFFCFLFFVVSTWRTVNKCVVRKRKSARTYCACQFAHGTIIMAEFLNQLLNSLTLLNSLKTAGELEYEWLNFATVKEFSPFPNWFQRPVCTFPFDPFNVGVRDENKFASGVSKFPLLESHWLTNSFTAPTPAGESAAGPCPN